MSRGGPRKAGGASKKGSKAAVTILTHQDPALIQIPDLPNPEDWIQLPPHLREDIDSLGLEIKWLQPVKEWWEYVWSSPMASEYVAADVFGLYLGCYYLNESLNPYYKASERLGFSKQFEATMKNYGLTPSARETLRWNIAQGTMAQNRTNQIRAMSQSNQPKPVSDDDIADMYSEFASD